MIEIQLRREHGIDCKEKHHGGLDLYDCECSEEAFKGLKPLITQIGNKEVTLPPSTFMKRKDGKCTLLMYPNDVSLSVERKWVVGDLFLQNYYTIFDVKDKKIGMVAPKGADSNLMKAPVATPVQAPANVTQAPAKATLNSTSAAVQIADSSDKKNK